VEGIGSRAEAKTKGSWIHVDNTTGVMSALSCIPGNCISCDDAAYPGDRAKDLRQEPLSPEGFARILGKGGVVAQNRATGNRSSTGGRDDPPKTAICNSTSSACLAWQQQIVGTCCRLGHHGSLCSYCDEGWVKAKELCMPCQSFDYGKLLLLLAMYGGLCVFFWRKATLKLRKAADVDENAQSAFIGITTFFLQTVMLLQIEVGVDVGFGALNLDPDSPSSGNTNKEGSCLTTGRFYVDWAIKFMIPISMALFAFLLCLVTQVKRHELLRTLVLIVQFGLFPCNLNALHIFFCRSESQLPSAVLRSDPSIVCWDSAHVLAFVAAVFIFCVCAIGTPVFLFRSIRQALLDQDKQHKMEVVGLAEDLTQGQTDAYTAVFHRYDADGSGTIDDVELSCVLEEKTGIKPNAEEVQELKEEYMGHLHADALPLDDFITLMALIKHELAASGNTQLHAMRHPLCLLYYPMRRGCYWWSIVMLLRPTVIAIAYEARNRGSGLVLGIADWRVLVVFYLLGYSNFQASYKPFKLSHESWLDSISVCILMAIFVADIQKDIDTIDDKTFLQVVFFCGLVVLVASATLAQWYTRKAIRCDPRAATIGILLSSSNLS
jgi:hypothetical protein